jgi:hypothetical protein
MFVLTSSLPCQEFPYFFKTLSLPTQSIMIPKRAGFDHLKLYLNHEENFFKIEYNCPPPESLLGVQLAGQRGTIPCI